MQTNTSAKENLIKYICLFFAITPKITLAFQLEPIPGVPSKPLDTVLGDITKWLLGFGVLICILIIVWGGVNYVASVGDEERIKHAKKSIHYAIFGALIIGLSYAAIKVINDVLIK